MHRRLHKKKNPFLMPIRRPVAGCDLVDHALIERALAATRRELVPERWHKGAPAVDARGRETDPEDDSSDAWCVEGILLRHLLEGSNATIRAAMRLLHQTARRLSEGRHDTLFAFNDAPATSFADIDRLLLAAVAEAAGRAAVDAEQLREPNPAAVEASPG